jgi:hypothetical protein
MMLRARRPYRFRMPNFLYKTRFRAWLFLQRVWSWVRRNAELIAAVFTAVLAAATLALVIAAIVQHADTVEAIATTNRLARAAEASAKENRRLASAGDRSAKSAEETLKTTRENFISTERPYVWLTNDLGRLEFPHQPGQNGQVFWTWRYTNYGKSPALGLQFGHFIKLGERPWEPSYSSHGTGPVLA